MGETERAGTGHSGTGLGTPEAPRPKEEEEEEVARDRAESSTRRVLTLRMRRGLGALGQSVSAGLSMR